MFPKTVEVTYHRPGERTPRVREGDVVLHEADRALGRAVSFMQRLRAPGRYARYSHASLVVDGDGGYVAEALEWGVEVEPLRKYLSRPYAVVHTGEAMDYRDGAQVMAYVDSVLYEIPNRYGYLTILSIALALLTGSGLVLGVSGSQICSGFVCEALVRAGYVFPKEPYAMTPADVARFFRVDGPPSGPPM